MHPVHFHSWALAAQVDLHNAWNKFETLGANAKKKLTRNPKPMHPPVLRHVLMVAALCRLGLLPCEI
jgi:hypothetical protein